MTAITFPPSKNSGRAVVVGASAGGIKALTTILPALPADYPLPVMVVIHMPRHKTTLVSDLFAPRCQAVVREADDKEQLVSGHIYFAPPDYHLLVEADHSLSLSNEEPVLFSRPSIDVLFESAADAYGSGLIGVILTGANEDGANGLKAVVNAGGRALIQTPETAYARAMPQAAIEACPTADVLSLDQIVTFLQKASPSCP